VRFATGDFFAAPLPQADVLVMGDILHDWRLEGKLKLLPSAHDALPDGGDLIVYEAIIDDERRENSFAPRPARAQTASRRRQEDSGRSRA
jgi:hypothetical protein